MADNASLSTEDREALDQIYIQHLKKENERLRDQLEQVDEWNKIHSMLVADADAVEAARCSADVAQPEREKLLEAAALDFIAKVDRGEARSTKSYAAFKAAIASQPSPAATVETLNEQAREHPRYDNPRDPFASPDRLADRLEQVRNRLTGDDIANPNICAALRSKPHNGSSAASEPVAYLHQCRDSVAEPQLGFEVARNPQWTSEPLYRAVPQTLPTREEIAKVIAPHAHAVVRLHGRGNASRFAVQELDLALEQADTILALSRPQSRTGET